MSNSVSETVAETIKPVVKPIIKPITTDNNTIFGYTYNAFIRKAAHVLEFMLLGILLFLLKVNSKRIQLFTILFTALAAAVTDETIQLFNGRTDSVKDILIDFAGSAAGIIVAASAMFMIKGIKSLYERSKK